MSGYRGTMALGMAVSDRPGELVVTALDLWDHGVTLRGTAETYPDRPRWLPADWELTTDAGTRHRCREGGGSPSGWEYWFSPTLPRTATEVRLFVGADLIPEHPQSTSLPAEPSLVFPVHDWPPAPGVVPATLADAGPAVDDGQELDIEARPLAVLPVSARLDGVGDRDVNVLSIDRYPHCFRLHLGGSGTLGLVRGHIYRRFKSPWTAVDDEGTPYTGTLAGIQGGSPWTISATFTPALPPACTTLTTTVPHPHHPTTITAPLPLP